MNDGGSDAGGSAAAQQSNEQQDREMRDRTQENPLHLKRPLEFEKYALSLSRMDASVSGGWG